MSWKGYSTEIANTTQNLERFPSCHVIILSRWEVVWYCHDFLFLQCYKSKSWVLFKEDVQYIINTLDTKVRTFLVMSCDHYVSTGGCFGTFIKSSSFTVLPCTVLTEKFAINRHENNIIGKEAFNVFQVSFQPLQSIKQTRICFFKQLKILYILGGENSR
jgi:hypothetical protein